MISMKKLTEYKYNKYSQWGEDGIIEKIFSIVGTSEKTCIEFGAWDGFHFSNTANLWTQSWKGILIEGKRKRYKELRKNTQGYNCICINQYVEKEGKNKLENILRRNRIDHEIDLLSIDIDGKIIT